MRVSARNPFGPRLREDQRERWPLAHKFFILATKAAESGAPADLLFATNPILKGLTHLAGQLPSTTSEEDRMEQIEQFLKESELARELFEKFGV